MSKHDALSYQTRIGLRRRVQAGAEGHAVSDVLPELTRQGPGASFYGGEIARQGATQFQGSGFIISF